MSARAIWKAVLQLGDKPVPVKFYSAVRDTRVHFRLLHARDHVPVRQEMVEPRSKRVVPYEQRRRAWKAERGKLVILEPDELEALRPEPSRDIEPLYFVPGGVIDPQWYDRPYYLGPDGDKRSYFSLVKALEDTGLEGVLRWVMRNKEYTGALRAYRGYAMLISLRHAEEVVQTSALEPPEGRALAKRELDMARQLMAALEAKFEPEQYRDQYRARVLEMIEHKRAGGKVKKSKARPKPASDDLAAALEASLGKARKRA